MMFFCRCRIVEFARPYSVYFCMFVLNEMEENGSCTFSTCVFFFLQSCLFHIQLIDFFKLCSLYK